VFDLAPEVFNRVKNGEQFTLNGRLFTVVRKNPVNGSLYHVVAES